MKKGDWGTAVQLHEKELREKYMSLYGNEKEYTMLLETMKKRLLVWFWKKVMIFTLYL